MKSDVFLVGDVVHQKRGLDVNHVRMFTYCQQFVFILLDVHVMN